MSLIKVLTFDPGGTTGYCLSLWDEQKIYIAYTQTRLNEIGIWRVIRDLDPDVIVYESFEYRDEAGAVDYTPIRLIGVINLYGQLYSTVEMHAQNAATGKGYFTDSKLRQLNLYRKGVDHGRDSARHALQWWQFMAGSRYWIHAHLKEPVFQLTTIDYLNTRFMS